VEAFRHAVVSLQASLLARPRDAGDAGDAERALPAAAGPEAHSALEITSDPVSVHNPEEVFEEPGTGSGAARKSENGDGRILSGFAQSGDRSLEEAHSKRRFAHGSGPLSPSAAPLADDAGDAETALAVDDRKDAVPGEDDPPVPVWLWIGVALAGSIMIMISAYLGLRGH
jgi:hypothetical protein